MSLISNHIRIVTKLEILLIDICPVVIDKILFEFRHRNGLSECLYTGNYKGDDNQEGTERKENTCFKKLAMGS